LCAALMAGCSAGAGTAYPGTGNATFTQHYFEGLASSPLATCAPVAAGILAGQSLDVSLFFGADTRRPKSSPVADAVFSRVSRACLKAVGVE
jgi:hypothetical protein